FSWAFFLGTKDETFYILKDFIALIENQLNKKVKAIRCDKRTEFWNEKLIVLYGTKGIKRDYSNARTPQQNGVAKRKNKTLIEAGLGQELYFDLDYLTDSLGYTRFKTNTPAGTPDNNINAGRQDDDSESKNDEQAILVPSFPSNSFSGRKVNEVSATMENHLDYAKELARLQRQEHEAHSTSKKYGFKLSNETAEMLHQAKIETHRNLVLAAGDPVGSIVSTGGLPAGSVPAGSIPTSSIPTSSVPASNVPASSVPASNVPASSVPADSVPTSSVPAGGVLASSVDSAGFSDPAASEYVPAVFNPDLADNYTLPHGHSLGLSEYSTRFPSPSDLRNHQPQAGIFSSSSYDDDFCVDVTNLASSVVVDPVATKRIAIGTKWILKNKGDAKGIVVRNKAKLVAQGHKQEEGIDYDEVFAPVARIESIRFFLAFASYMNFMVYQMDVKSAFLYGEIEEEVYVTQPKGFEDPYNPKHVYRVVSLVWTSSSTKVLVYVDDIIFGSTNKARCDEFEVLMKEEFEMSAMDKYVKVMLKKFDMESIRTATTPYEVPKPKSKDEPDDAVNVHLYRSMIGSFMYLTASRPDIIFAVYGTLEILLFSWKLTVIMTMLGLMVIGNPQLVDANFWVEVAVVRMNVVSCGFLLYSVQIVSMHPMPLVVQVFLLMVLVHADGLVPAGCCTIPTGSYSFMLLDWTYNFSRFILDGMIENIGSKRHKLLMYLRFLQMILGIQTTDPSPRPTFDLTTKLFSNMKLNWDGPHMPLLAPMLVVLTGGDGVDAAAAGAATANEVPPPPPPHVTPPPDVPPTHTSSSTPGQSTATQDTPVRDPTPIREPTPVREPAPSPVREPTTFQEPTPEPPRPSPLPCPTMQTSYIEDISEDGGGVSSLKSNEAPPTIATTTAGGAEDSVALTGLSLKLDRCINRVTTLENELGVTKKVLGGVVLKLVSKEINLDALHELASMSLGGDTTVEAAYTIYKASQDAHASSDVGHDEDEVPDSSTMPFRHTRTKQSIPIPTKGGIFAGSSIDPTGQAAIVTLSSSAILAVDKGKAFMVDDSILTDLLTQQERLLGDDVNEDNMNERLGMLLMRKRRKLAEQSRVKPMNKTQQRDFLRDFIKTQSASVYKQCWTMKQSTFRPTPTLEAPTAKRARQEVPQVPADFSQVPASVPATLSIAADVSVSVVSTTTADVSPPPTLPDESVAEVHANERRKQIARKRVTPIVDVADDALIKFNSASESDGDPSPYVPYAGWEQVPTPFGFIHAYYDMEEHTKHFTSLRKLLHMVEKNDLRRFEATLERMLRHGLEVPKLLVGGDLTMAEQLVRFIKAALLNAQSTV
nr:hypothetical protein [Tanacetum cinerariifolium]